MRRPEHATIELLSLREALDDGDELAWLAFRHAADAADGLDAHPGLGRCGGCARPWTRDRGPVGLAVVEVAGDPAVTLLCKGCARGPARQVRDLLERILRSALPEGARTVDVSEIHGPAGHA